MFSLYNALKFVHLLSVIAWLGGLVMLMLLSYRFRRLGDPAAMRALSQQGRVLAMGFFVPAALVAIITGIGMVQVGKLGFGTLWVSAGMTGALLAFIVGGAFAGRIAANAAKRLAAGQMDAAQAAAVQQRILTISVINLIVLIAVVFVMVFKPH